MPKYRSSSLIAAFLVPSFLSGGNTGFAQGDLAAPKTAQVETDPLAPYLDGLPPRIIREVPASRPVPEDVTVNPTVFELNGSEVFAFIARPKAPGKYPGILIFHGSGGAAEVSRAMYWAQRGYVAVAPDLPGVAAAKSLIHTRGRWNSLATFEERYNVTPSIRNSLLFDAVTSGVKALALLRAQPDVDPTRIGVVGVSYGGYMTCMVSALAGDQVRAAFSVYGCGFFEDASPGKEALARLSPEKRDLWLRWLDAGRRLGGLKAPLFIAGATNDFFFFPKAVQNTLDHIGGAKNHVFAPNANHSVPVPGGSTKQPIFSQAPLQPGSSPVAITKPAFGTFVDMEIPYFDYHLKGLGSPFPGVELETSPDQRTARFRVQGTEAVQSACIYWAKEDPSVMNRQWSSVTATQTPGGIYEASVPEDATDWFALVSDDRPVSVSSRMVHVPQNVPSK